MVHFTICKRNGSIKMISFFFLLHDNFYRQFIFIRMDTHTLSDRLTAVITPFMQVGWHFTTAGTVTILFT